MMHICRHCRQLFDSAVVSDVDGKWAEPPPCSWHPGEPIDMDKTAGPDYNYRDLYRWNCCGKVSLSSIRNDAGFRDAPPPRSPGCVRGDHEMDPDLTLDVALAEAIAAVQRRLREIEMREIMARDYPGVFISYSHADHAFVDRLATMLDHDQITYWRDVKDLLVGDVIDREISRGIQAHALFLVVLSPASIDSRWVSRELDEASHEASEGRKLLLPVLTGGLSVNAVPARLRRFKCADFNNDFASAYRALKTAIVVHLGRMVETRKPDA